jgi:uncharacterized protein with ParB-like and HNH nuclease domain
MALLKDELAIASINKILTMELTLPSYQRPYRWSVASTNTLFIDTYEAFKNNLPEYRLGTVILHKDSSNVYNIVDGQQRLTTLSILLYTLGKENQRLLREKYSNLSNDAILRNHRVLSRRINELDDDEKEKYTTYLL